MPTTDELQAQIDALTARVVVMETRFADHDAMEQAIKDVLAEHAAGEAGQRAPFQNDVL